MLVVQSTQSPAIYRARDGHRYIVGGTVQSVDNVPVKSGVVRLLDDTIRLDDIRWIRPTVSTTRPSATIQIRGSHGNVYTLTIVHKKAVRCTCDGFTYRRTCKHLKQYKSQ